MRVSFLCQIELRQAAVEAAGLPIVFAKFMDIAADTRAAEDRGHGKSELSRRAGVPGGALVNPGAQEGDLGGGKGIALADGGHFHCVN